MSDAHVDSEYSPDKKKHPRASFNSYGNDKSLLLFMFYIDVSGWFVLAELEGEAGSLALLCLLKSATCAGFIHETVLFFDRIDGGDVGLEFGIAIEVWEYMDLSVGASVREESREIGCIGWTPVEGGGGRREALDLRCVVLRVEHPFDGCCMRVSEGVAVIGSEEIVSNSLPAEPVSGQPAPHPLAISGLEMMRTAIRPYLDGIEEIVEFLDEEEKKEGGEDEVMSITSLVMS